MKINYKNIEIVIFRNYEGKYGTEQEHLDTITGDDVHSWEDDGRIGLEDIIDKVRSVLDSAYMKDKLKEEK